MLSLSWDLRSSIIGWGAVLAPVSPWCAEKTVSKANSSTRSKITKKGIYITPAWVSPTASITPASIASIASSTPASSTTIAWDMSVCEFKGCGRIAYLGHRRLGHHRLGHAEERE